MNRFGLEMRDIRALPRDLIRDASSTCVIARGGEDFDVDVATDDDRRGVREQWLRIAIQSQRGEPRCFAWRRACSEYGFDRNRPRAAHRIDEHVFARIEAGEHEQHRGEVLAQWRFTRLASPSAL